MNFSIRIPDAINCSARDNFTRVHNDILRNPALSFKAKGILSLLLSNKEGWTSYFSAIQSMGTDGKDSIQTGIYELEEFQYLKRYQYRDILTKKYKGSFWAYCDIPGNFDLTETLLYLEKNGFELIFKNPLTENPLTENPLTENPLQTIPIFNKTNVQEDLSSKEEIRVFSKPVISQSSFSRNNPPIVIPQPKVKPTKEKKIYPIVPESHPAWELLNLWNKHPACPHTHKLIPNSALINRVKKFYDELTNGIFFRNKKFSFQKSSNFFETKTNEQMIQWEKEGKKFSHNEIIGGLRKAMLNYIQGYYPSNKEKLPQSLTDLFYVDYFGISLFINSIVIPPKELKDTITIKEIDPDLTNEILDAAGAERTPANVKKANEFIRQTKTHWDITTDTYDINGYGRDFYKQHPSWYMFVVRYIEWMKDNAWPSVIDIGCFDAGGGVLRTWYEHLRKEYSDEDCDFKIIRKPF